MQYAENDPELQPQPEGETQTEAELEQLVAENSPPARGPESPLKRGALTGRRSGISR